MCFLCSSSLCWYWHWCWSRVRVWASLLHSFSTALWDNTATWSDVWPARGITPYFKCALVLFWTNGENKNTYRQNWAFLCQSSVNIRRKSCRCSVETRSNLFNTLDSGTTATAPNMTKSILNLVQTPKKQNICETFPLPAHRRVYQTKEEELIDVSVVILSLYCVFPIFHGKYIWNHYFF